MAEKGNIFKNLVGYFSKNSEKNVKELNYFPEGGSAYQENFGDSIGPIKSSSGSYTGARVSRAELERAYLKDPLVFNSINKNVQMIMAAGSTNVAENKKDKKNIDEFLLNISEVGTPITWEELESHIFWSEMTYGLSFIEKIFDEKTDKKIVDLGKMDAKITDYARDSNGNIVFGSDMKPIGFTQKLPLGIADATELGDEVPDEFKSIIDLSEKIFLLSKRVAVIKLYPAGDEYESIGLIEPSYQSTIRKLNLEEANANSIYQRGTAPLVAYVGSENKPPTPQLMKQTVEEMKKFKHDRYFAFPYYTRIEEVGGKANQLMNEALKYFQKNQTSSLGIPLPFATGSGEATNRATLNNQGKLLEFTLNDVAKRTVSAINKFIYKPIAETNGWKTSPKLLWHYVSVDEYEDKSDRLIKYVDSGIFTPEEVRPTIIELENLNLPAKLPKTNNDKKTPPNDAKKPKDTARDGGTDAS